MNLGEFSADALPVIEALRRYVVHLHMLEEVALKDPNGFAKHMQHYIERLGEWEREQAERPPSEEGVEQFDRVEVFKQDMLSIACRAKDAEESAMDGEIIDGTTTGLEPVPAASAASRASCS